MAGSHGGSAESKAAALYRVGEWLIDNRGWVSLVTIAFTAFMACEAFTFFCRNHQGDTVARIIQRCREYIANLLGEDRAVHLTIMFEVD